VPVSASAAVPGPRPPASRIIIQRPVRPGTGCLRVGLRVGVAGYYYLNSDSGSEAGPRAAARLQVESRLNPSPNLKIRYHNDHNDMMMTTMMMNRLGIGPPGLQVSKLEATEPAASSSSQVTGRAGPGSQLDSNRPE
jgi:hypothetical protein